MLHERTLIHFQKRKEFAIKKRIYFFVNVKQIMPRLWRVTCYDASQYGNNARKKKSPLHNWLQNYVTDCQHTMPQSYQSNFIYVTYLHRYLQYMWESCCSQHQKLLWPMWPRIYLMERYPHPSYYHCSESYRSQLYPRPVHHLAFLYFFFSVRHLKGKFFYFITKAGL